MVTYLARRFSSFPSWPINRKSLCCRNLSALSLSKRFDMLHRRVSRVSVGSLSHGTRLVSHRSRWIHLAFPSVGCGKLNFDHSLIAKTMIDETRSALISFDAKLDVSFILLPKQQNVYDEFVKYLNPHGSAKVDGSATRKTAAQGSIPYDEKGKTRSAGVLRKRPMLFDFSDENNLD